MTREAWHEGWQRYDDIIYVGHPHCAGCGRLIGTACIAVDDNWTPPPDPQWPFDEDSCPLCALRNSEPEPLGMLPTAANLWRELKACKLELAAARAALSADNRMTTKNTYGGR